MVKIFDQFNQLTGERVVKNDLGRTRKSVYEGFPSWFTGTLHASGPMINEAMSNMFEILANYLYAKKVSYEFNLKGIGGDRKVYVDIAVGPGTVPGGLKPVKLTKGIISKLNAEVKRSAKRLTRNHKKSTKVGFVETNVKKLKGKYVRGIEADDMRDLFARMKRSINSGRHSARMWSDYDLKYHVDVKFKNRETYDCHVMHVKLGWDDVDEWPTKDFIKMMGAELTKAQVPYDVKVVSKYSPELQNFSFSTEFVISIKSGLSCAIVPSSEVRKITSNIKDVAGMGSF